MTVEEHLRVLIGDLVLRVAQLAAENDALKQTVAALTPTTAPNDADASQRKD